ncbi:hypothetical protein ACKI14_50085, partial [Streptomyces turgidiscabies]
MVLAPTLPSMFVQMWALQRACEIQVATLGMNRPAIMIPDEVIAVHQRDLREVQVPGTMPGATDFAAWTRKIDRIDPS